MLMMPSCDCSIQDHTSAATTPEMRNGRMIRPRMTVERVSRCITTAVSRAKKMPIPTDMATK